MKAVKSYSASFLLLQRQRKFHLNRVEHAWSNRIYVLTVLQELLPVLMWYWCSCFISHCYNCVFLYLNCLYTLYFSLQNIWNMLYLLFILAGQRMKWEIMLHLVSFNLSPLAVWLCSLRALNMDHIAVSDYTEPSPKLPVFLSYKMYTL